MTLSHTKNIFCVICLTALLFVNSALADAYYWSEITPNPPGNNSSWEAIGISDSDKILVKTVLSGCSGLACRRLYILDNGQYTNVPLPPGDWSLGQASIVDSANGPLVAGTLSTPNGQRRLFLVQQNVASILPFTPYQSAEKCYVGQLVNGEGYVVGKVSNVPGTPFVNRASVWSGATRRDAIPSGANFSCLGAISPSGYAVGSYTDTSYHNHPYLVKIAPNELQFVSLPDTAVTTGTLLMTAVNDLQTAIGLALPLMAPAQSVRWGDGTLQVIGAPSFCPHSVEAAGIDPTGFAVGHCAEVNGLPPTNALALLPSDTAWHEISPRAKPDLPPGSSLRRPSAPNASGKFVVTIVSNYVTIGSAVVWR